MSQFRRRLLAFGFQQHQLELKPTAGYTAYLELLNQTDLILDTFPRTGGTTTADALWMGVSVITLAGKRYVERISMSKLKSLQLDELICENEQAYINTAVTLAKDDARRAEISAGLRERMRRSELMDGPGLALALEKAYDYFIGQVVSLRHDL